MKGNWVVAEVPRSDSPSGLARAANWLVPVIEPPPPTFLTTMVGLPGSSAAISGAKNRAQTYEPPPVVKGMVHSIVFPEKSAAAATPGSDNPSSAAAAHRIPRRLTIVIGSSL